MNTNSFLVDLPTTVNYNNEIIKNEFNYIYDSKNNYVRQSLNAPNGSVKAHWGQFVNLRVSNLIVENQINSSNNDVLNSENYINHEDIWKRFSWELSSLPNPTTESISSFAHDTHIIVSWANTENPIYIGKEKIIQPISLRQELDKIETIVNGLAKNLSIKEVETVKSEDESEIQPQVVNLENDELYGGYVGNLVVPTEDILLSRIEMIEEEIKNIKHRLDVMEGK